MATDAPKNDRERWVGFERLPLRVVVRVGKARLRLRRLASLARGELIVLDSRVGAPFELLANGVVLGRVEPVGTDGGVAVKLAAAGDGEVDR